MAKEIEAKFLKVDHAEVRAKLQELGAVQEQPMRLMRRALFDFPDGRLQADNWGRLRVRDEGDKITLTYKSGGSGEYSEEAETIVGSFDDTVEILKAIGLEQFSFQESKRETWHYKDVEIVLDEWPWLDTYIEIEGQNEEAIKSCSNDLGFDWRQAAFGNVDVAYRIQYPGMGEDETISAVGTVSFDDDLPKWLADRQST